MKNAIILLDTLQLPKETSFKINENFYVYESKGKTFLKANIEENPTPESTPSLFVHALNLTFANTLISTFCKQTDEAYYKCFWKPVVLFSYYGKTEYRTPKNQEFTNERIKRLIEWHRIIVAHNKACKENLDLRCTSWNIAYNEYIDSVSCGIAEKSFAHLITALEALLIEGNSELNHRVAINTALLYTENPTERKRVYELVKKAYSIRSITVHGDAKALKKKLKTNEIYELLFNLKDIVAELLFCTYQKDKNTIITAIETAQYNCPAIQI